MEIRGGDKSRRDKEVPLWQWLLSIFLVVVILTLILKPVIRVIYENAAKAERAAATVRSS